MATRGSALSRAVGFFRSASLDEARAAFIIVNEVMQERLQASVVQTPAPKVRRGRKAKASADAAAGVAQSTLV